MEAQIEANCWHVHAVCLPDGERAEHWWFVDGRLSDRPVPGAQDLPGGWVLPGLVDAHTHLTLDFANTGLRQGSAELIAANLERHLRAGVLAVRDTGAIPGASIGRREPHEPVTLAAGRFLAPPGGYYPPLFQGVGPQKLIAAALAEVESGATWVKIIADFPGPDGNWLAPRVHYPAELLRTLVREVHAAGARVAAHVSGPFVADLVRAGIDSIEHGPLVDPDLLREMAGQGTAWTPTLLTVAGVFDQLAASAGPAASIGHEALARLGETIPLAAQLGVPLLAGTDESPPGTIAGEVAQLRRFGLSPAAALAAASTGARAYLGLPALVAGAPADLVTFASDPRRDLQALMQPAAVLRNGVRVA